MLDIGNLSNFCALFPGAVSPGTVGWQIFFMELTVVDQYISPPGELNYRRHQSIFGMLDVSYIGDYTVISFQAVRNCAVRVGMGCILYFETITKLVLSRIKFCEDGLRLDITGIQGEIRRLKQSKNSIFQ